MGGYFIWNNLKMKNQMGSKTTSDIDKEVNVEQKEIDWSNYDEKTITETKTIKEEGTYTLSGEINGSIVVNVKGNVKLIFDNVTIKSSNWPAILIEEAENTLISLKEGTTNLLEDSASYSLEDEGINAVIYSKDDLYFEGTGTLIAAGSSGMLQSVSSSKQYNVTVAFSSSYQSGKKVTILDANKKEIIAYTPNKAFSAITISSPLLSGNQTYTIQIDGSTYTTFTTSSYTTMIGNSFKNSRR